MEGQLSTDETLQRELAYYKKLLVQMSGESIRADFTVSSLQNDLKRKNEAFAILTHLQKTFTVDTPNDLIFSTTINAVNTQLGMDRTLILIPTDESNKYKPAYYYGYPDEQLAILENREIEIPSVLLEPDRCYLVNKKTVPEEIARHIQLLFFINYFIGVPIFIDTKPICFFITGRQFEKLPFHPQLNNNDVDTMLAIAGLISSIIQNKNLMELRLQMKQQLNENEVIRHMLAELKAAQAQLIQKEKMASLGELTSGIAHEIVNPLNFVNNFSEINQELTHELKNELIAGNLNAAISIAEDLINNEQKISFHGKRADGIVKSMLEHSRQSSGEKQPTDINALVDEYLRLAYHGFKAKDKSFDIKLETQLDELDKIDVVPQDLGRALLNLYNNAFYAVWKKKQLLNGCFKPNVIVSTKCKNNRLEISVRDNGDGIPKNLVTKIFQPFFTTKPTGQGTGLGLSLSYDIIKAHQGLLNVATKEGEFTEFTIQLPV